MRNLTPARLSNELQQSQASPNSHHVNLIAQLQKRAASHLPGPMCPAHYVILPDLPLTPARKLDRQALPSPLNGRPNLVEDFIPARDTLEIHLTGLMRETLGISPIGVRDGCFDLGGDSLRTVELLLAIEEKLGARIELGQFLEQPTAEGLAAIVNKQRGFRPATSLVSVKPDGDEAPLFFIHGAGGLAFTVFELGKALTCRRPVFAVQDPACDPKIDPAVRVEDMAAALIEQIRTVQPAGLIVFAVIRSVAY